jgi:hypothetical protein
VSALSQSIAHTLTHTLLSPSLSRTLHRSIHLSHASPPLHHTPTLTCHDWRPVLARTVILVLPLPLSPLPPPPPLLPPDFPSPHPLPLHPLASSGPGPKRGPNALPAPRLLGVSMSRSLFVCLFVCLLGCVHLLPTLSYAVHTTDSRTDNVSVFGEPLRYQSGRGYPSEVCGQLGCAHTAGGTSLDSIHRCHSLYTALPPISPGVWLPEVRWSRAVAHSRLLAPTSTLP